MIFCVERLRDFPHSFSHSLRLHDFFGGCAIFCGEVANSFCVERLRVFFEMRLHIFCVERLLEKRFSGENSFLVTKVFG